MGRALVVSVLLIGGALSAFGQPVQQPASPAMTKRDAETVILAAAENETSSKAITVSILVAISPTNPPLISGTTNLPDGTVLNAYLQGIPTERGLPACSPKCYIEFRPIVVKNFSFSAELKGIEKIIQDYYLLDITVMTNEAQPPSVQSAIGKLGEHLRGPYVVATNDFLKIKGVDLPGHMIHFTKKIFVANDPTSDARAKAQANSDHLEWVVRSCTNQFDFTNALICARRWNSWPLERRRFAAAAE